MLLNRAQRASNQRFAVPLLILINFMESEGKNGFSNSMFVMVCVVCGKIEFRVSAVFFPNFLHYSADNPVAMSADQLFGDRVYYQVHKLKGNNAKKRLAFG